MSKLNIGNIDILIEDIGNKFEQVNYANWNENKVLSETIVKGLDSDDIDKLDKSLTELISSNIYYLMLRTNEDYKIFSRDTKFGVLCDVVDSNMEGKLRYHYLRLDLVTGLLFSKYPDDIVKISKLLKNEDFETLDNNSILKVGEFIV